ncbi:MAG: M1 family metallopeptidase, partial [Ginsengibacter sp.]
MKKIFFTFFLFCQLHSYCQTKYFQQQVNYTIDVTLNDVQNTLDGFEIMNYTNNSPDTLHFIWIHLWPNAYKNDRTAFSEQLLKIGRTDFYFSNEKKRGYINRLNFKVNDILANFDDDSQNIDVAKLILPTPLLPGKTIKISTPFHEKIPFNFSRGGYVDHTYQITQWYPKPAVYDSKGWHPIPYLDQGEFYSEFGNFQVQITVPENYVIAATGELQNKDEVKWLEEKALDKEHLEIRNNEPEIAKELTEENKKKTKIKYQPTTKKKKIINKPPETNQAVETPGPKTEKTKTLTYIQNNVHDFAWFADKSFIIKHDTLQLPSGKIIDAFSFFTPSGSTVWKNSIQFIKDAIKTRSQWLGEYPYNTVTAVEAKMGFSGGMEYPTITCISPTFDEKSLDMTIEHEVGHNWVYGILATNEREHPWMDEGMNTYFDNRYEKIKYPLKNQDIKSKDFLDKRLPDDNADIVYRTQIVSKKDQPIETSSEDFSETNYGVIAYYKTGLWMKKLEDFIGKNLFDSCLQEYYNLWKFKHPYPEDFKTVIVDVSKKNVDTIFSFLSKKGRLEPTKKKQFKMASFFNFTNTDKYNYFFLSPAIGYNFYDKIMIGGLVHNYTLPEPKFHFFVAPLYATGSKTIEGTGRIGYNFMSYGAIRKTEISLSAEKFSLDEFTDSTGAKNYLGFSKIVPSLKLIFKNKNATSSVKKWVQWKTYFIQETALSFSKD